MYKRREGLFHSDGRTSSTYITCCGQQFFHGNEVNFLVATEFGGFFQVYLMVTGDDTHEMLGLLAEEYQRLENLIDVFSNGSSQMPCREVVLIDLVGNEFVGNLSSVEKSCCVSLCYLFHDSICFPLAKVINSFQLSTLF